MPGQDHETSEGYDGMDALMAAITDAPLPEEARADPACLAAHRKATADVALLREQLGVIADALTEPPREPAPVRPVRQPRRPFLPVALRAVGVAAASALVVGTGWLVVRTGGGANDDSGASSASDKAATDESAAGAGGLLGDPGWLSCARLVVEGDVTGVAPVAGTGQERITLRVTRSYKPAKSPGTVEFVMEEDVDPLVAEGDHVLAGFTKESSGPEVWAVGAADIAVERAALTDALPRSAGGTCG
ncbi:hypothetical protein ACIBVL_34015 [Streptomyces sp. NPDC049687]|uniref:hypothetical protein n=1 Tax=Streptomyces sp. NPDC049687 TaxID=3365596 RepID=UPI00379F721F